MRLLPTSVPVLLAFLTLAALAGGAAEEAKWIDLSADKALAGWLAPTDGWTFAGGAELDTQNPRRLTAKDGTGVLVNTAGKARNLVSKQKFTDAEVHLEFLIPKGSNSGVKMMGLYE